MFCLVLCSTQLVFSLATCFHVNMRLMSVLISCVSVSSFCLGTWFVIVLAGHVLMFLSCLVYASTWLVMC